MKKNTFLFSALIVLIRLQFSYAQAPDWSRLLQLNTYGAQNGNALTADASHIYMAGDISGPVTFEGSNYTSTGNHDMILTKISNSGTAVWTKQFNADANGSISPNVIQVDASQNIYVSGTFTGTITIGSNTITSGVLYNSFLAKFNANGNGVWITAYLAGATLGTSGTCKLALDASSNCYLISNGSKLLKFNTSGLVQWEQSYAIRTLHAIAVYNSNLYVGGTLQEITTFGSITLTPIGAYNTGFLVRADLNGVYDHSLIVNGEHSTDGNSVSDIVMDNTGNLIITGGYTKELILDTITITNATNSYYTYIAKCNSNFVFAWAKSSTSTAGLNRQLWTYRLFADNSNNIYEYGLTNTSFSYGSIPVNPNGGQFLVIFDANGNATSSAALKNTSYNKIHVTPGGKILTTGSYDYTGAASYGDFYLNQYNSNMTLDWQKKSTNSKSGTAKVNFVQHDSIGNTYIQTRVTGYCNYFGTLLNSDTSKTIISKHDLSGNLVWMNQVADIPQFLFGPGLTLDKDNNVLTVGLFQTSLKIGSTTLTSANTGNEGYVAKYSPGGIFLWAEKMNLNVTNNISLATDNAGNVIVIGVIPPANFLVKFDASGNRLWTKSFPMESLYNSLVSTDAQNNIYMATEIHLSDATGSATIGSLTLTQTYDDGATALIKFDPDGNAIWAKTYGGVPGSSYSDGWPVDIKTDADGNSYLLGICPNNSVFGTSTLTNPLDKPFYSTYLTKIDSSGTVVWANGIYGEKFASNYGDLLDLDKAGNIYVGGHFNDSISISDTIYTPEGLYDFYVNKYSNNGVFQWIKTIPSDARIIHGLAAFGDSILTIVGSAGKNSTLGIFPVVKEGGSSCIIATLNNLPLGIKEPTTNYMFNIYPNPSRGIVRIEMKDGKNNTENSQLRILNMLGETIRTIPHWKLQPSGEIDLSDLRKGMYFITIGNGVKRSTKKIVIQ